MGHLVQPPCQSRVTYSRLHRTFTRDEPRLGVPGSGMRLAAQLKCVYTNARSMGNKQEELEAIIQQDGYDLVAITET